MVASGWVDGEGDEDQALRLRDEIAVIADSRPTAIGIDAPRMPLPNTREWKY